MKHRKMKKGVAILLVILVILGGLVIAYNHHMHYEIEPHVSYNLGNVKDEGRSFDGSSVVFVESAADHI